MEENRINREMSEEIERKKHEEADRMKKAQDAY